MRFIISIFTNNNSKNQFVMQKNLLLLFALSIGFGANAQNNDNIYSTAKRLDKTYITDNKRLPDVEYQYRLRHQKAWQDYLTENGTWYVVFNEENHKPHRAYGKPINVSGTTPELKVRNFISEKLAGFNIPSNELVLSNVGETSKHIFVTLNQKHQGLDVLFGRFKAKLTHNDQIISWGADVYPDINISTQAGINAQSIESYSTNGIVDNITSVTVNPALKILPVPYFKSMKYKLVYEVNVETMGENKVPANWFTWLDANTGEVLYRQNLVMHCSTGKCGHDEGFHGKEDFTKKIAASKIISKPPPGDIEINVEATVYPNNPDGGTAIVPLANLDFTVAGNAYQTDAVGFSTTTETGTQTVALSLEGQWGIVVNDGTGTTPNFTTTATAGTTTTVSWDGNATLEELCGYNNVNAIHDYMKSVLPSFTGMDFQLPINIDITPPECNAFYNGSSINFYSTTATCRSYAMVADVVFHEYGHGINDKYYQSQGSWFQNGGMGEGYADVWGFAELEDPILGNGSDPADPTASIRRYDTLAKVYPIDIVGEVHADGEIIAGAWWDLYLLLGNDMPTTMNLFALAYPGLQAATANGNEGVAFTEVLLDVLEADDDDGDITNGTPNGTAIITAFDMHGITLISNAELTHTAVESNPATTDIDISANLQLSFPWTDYLNSVSCWYRVNNGTTWAQAALTNTSGNTYDGVIPGQATGTVVAYYVGAEDINGMVSAVNPIGAEKLEYPNLPNYVLVDMIEMEKEDGGDMSSDWGNWTTGLGSDNNTTGGWELNIPLGSYADLNGDGSADVNDPTAAVAPSYQHTLNGDLCFLTERGSLVTDGLGVADVDAGHTTLLSPVIDLTGYTTPVMSFYRWYTNNPASGANPNADWWQVAISDDAGTSWTYVENTKTGDRDWRRFAYRIQDYVNVNSSFQMKFIVSDSTRLGQYLDGGSLIEAAVDDISIWDAAPNSIKEITGVDFKLYPNPAGNSIQLSIVGSLNKETSFEIRNQLGQLIESGNLSVNTTTRKINISALDKGVYYMVIRSEGNTVTKPFTKM